MVTDEQQRVEKLYSLGLLDSAPEDFFDTITRVASTILDMPISLISLVDEHRQWFKSKQGLELTETSRDISFCTHAVESGEQLIIENALTDARFANNPLVLNAPNIRFYAGIPIKSLEGYTLGTLCVIDEKPKKLTDRELAALNDLAHLATREIQFRERMLVAQQSIETSESKFKALFDSAAIGIAMVKPNGRWSETNEELCRIVGYSRAELLALTFQDITFPEDLNTDLNLLDQLVAGKLSRYQLEKRYIKKDGTLVWVELTVTKQLTASGELDYFVSIVKDIQSAKETELALTLLRKTLEDKVSQRTAELKQANKAMLAAYQEKTASEQLLQNAELELRTILDNANDAYVCMDADGIVKAWNKQAERIFGWGDEEAIGRKLDKLIIPNELQQAHQAGMRRYALEKSSDMMGKRIELEAIRKDGVRIPVEMQVNVLEINEQTLFTSFLRDITDRKQLESLLKNEARNDALTGLPNRRKLEEILPIAVQRAKSNQTALSILFVDLDGFKSVNDTYGHTVGDMLLREVANRIDKSTRQSDMVARYAGDEFIIVLEGVTQVTDASKIAEKVLRAISEPFHFNQICLNITVSIGIAYYSSEQSQETQPNELIRQADKAMYIAKKNGKNGVFMVQTTSFV
ncbi:PAS domain S-box protein [Methylophilus sp.]|jgi:diguanylate cyclase|uniref:PAS domain S-box protein n=1 Tax=Methylophilus sp. TaxID=29541 RepID=UPI0011DB98DA|nr:PAS domain S-box protein [Methylophilus sp.]TXI47185.1 MAG: PAS domain S-box protein [Methylophilus sp.]